MSRYTIERRQRRQRQADRIEEGGLWLALILSAVGLLGIPAAALELVTIQTAAALGAVGFCGAPVAALGSLALSALWEGRA